MYRSREAGRDGACLTNRAGPSFIDVFAGCGGLSLGLMRSGWRGLFGVEKEVNAFATLMHNLGSGGSRFRYDWPKWLPATPHDALTLLTEYRLNLSALAGSVDLLVGGPPCQGFSSAGLRDPSDPRNQLIEAYLELVDIVQPKIVLIENVRGITAGFDHPNGRSKKINFAERLIDSLSDRYHVWTSLIDSSRYGVPQRRLRFFAIGILADYSVLGDPFDLLEEARDGFLDDKGLHSLPVQSRQALSDLEVERNGTTPSQESKGFSEIAFAAPRTRFQRLMNEDVSGRLSDTRLAQHRPETVTRFRRILALCQASGHLNCALTADMREELGIRKRALRVLDPSRPAPTITSMPDDLLHYQEPRTLTVRETARLQAFPDWFEFKGKYTTGAELRRIEVPRFTQVANAVPPLVAEAIGLTLLDMHTQLV